MRSPRCAIPNWVLESLVTANKFNEAEMVESTAAATLLATEAKTMHAEYRPNVKELV